MSYSKSDGTFVYSEPFPALGSSARTTSSNSSAVEVGNREELRGLFLNVTAASGSSPTLDVRVETSNDSSSWYTVAAFAQKTGVSSERKSFAGLDRYVRVAWTIGGSTPSFTFDVNSGELV